MPIDQTKLVNPLKGEVTDSSNSGLVSPFQISEVAEEVKTMAPDIGPLEELEGYLSFATSMLATPVAGIEGLRRQILQDLGFKQEVSPTQAIEDVTRGLTYEPSTKAGQEFAEKLATPFVYVDEGAQWVGDRVYDLTESPGLSANAKAATMFMVPSAARKTYKGGKAVVKQAVSGASFVAETVNMLRPKARRTFSREAVGQSLRKNIGDSPEVTANIAKTTELTKSIPAFKPTLAETTLKPSVMVRERTLAEADQPAYDLAKSRRAENVRAIEDFRLENFGDSAPEISVILRKSEGNVNKALNMLDERLSDIHLRREALAKKTPTMEPEIVGNRLRALEQKEYHTAKAIGEVLYNKVGNARVDPTPIANEVSSLFKNELLDFSQDQIPTSVRYVGRTLTPEKAAEGMSFDSLRSLEKRLKRDLASERGKPGRSPETERIIAKVLERVDEVKDSLSKTGSADVVKALDEANTFWKEGVADRFYRGAGRDINAKTPFNEYRIVDEKVIDSFFSKATKTKGGVKGIDDFINTYGMNPEAWAQLRIGIYNKFRDASGITTTGVIDSAKAARFLDNYKPIFDRIPQIRNELSNIHIANKNLDGMAQLVKKRQVNIEHSILSKTLKSNTPDTVVKKSIKEHSKDMNELLSMAKKTKGGREALSRETGRQLLAKAERTDGTINSAKLLNEMEKNKASLKVGMTPEHFRNLELLHQAYLRIDTNVLPAGIKEPKLGLEKAAAQIGTTPAQAISAWRAKSRGLVGGPHLVAQIGTSFIATLNKRQINALERIAHYDPNVAKTLLKMSKTEKITPKMENQISKYLADYGLVSMAASVKEQEEE